MNLFGDSQLEGTIATKALGNNFSMRGIRADGDFSYPVYYLIEMINNSDQTSSLLFLIANSYGGQDFSLSQKQRGRSFKTAYRALLGACDKHSGSVYCMTQWMPPVFRDHEQRPDNRPLEAYNCDVLMVAAEYGATVIDGASFEFDDSDYTDGLHHTESAKARLCDLIQSNM